MDFPSVSRLQQILVFVLYCMGITVLKDNTSRHMFLPLPANSLMQSAWHVTAYDRIHFWISKYEYNADVSCRMECRCNSLPAYWHTLHFVANGIFTSDSFMWVCMLG